MVPRQVLRPATIPAILARCTAYRNRLPLLHDLPPRFISIMVENHDGPGPPGAKGMSQTAVSPIAPAIANAIYDAVGVRITASPITPEKILRGLGKLA